MIGRCVSWRSYKGYGFIKGDDMRMYFVHISDVWDKNADGNRDLIQYGKYEFEPIETVKGWRAIDVRRCRNEKSDSDSGGDALPILSNDSDGG